MQRLIMQNCSSWWMTTIGWLYVYRRAFGCLARLGVAYLLKLHFISRQTIIYLFGGCKCLAGAFAVILSVSAASSRCDFSCSLSHLKQFHKTDYADDESITFQLLLVQDAEMKLGEHIIVGDVLHFSFITEMEWVTRCRSAQSLNQVSAVPGGCGCAAC